MKVRELIEKLSSLDPELEVLVGSDSGGPGNRYLARARSSLTIQTVERTLPKNPNYRSIEKDTGQELDRNSSKGRGVLIDYV